MNLLKDRDYQVIIPIAALVIFSVLAGGAVTIYQKTVLFSFILLLSAYQFISGFRNRSRYIIRPHLTNPILIFLFMAIVTAFQSEFLYASLKKLSELICFILFYFLLAASLESSHRRRKLLWIIVLFGGMCAVVSLMAAGGELLGIHIFSPRNLRVSLTFVNPNHFSGYMTMTTWLGLGMALFYRDGKRIFLFTLVVFSISACVFTLSRGGITALIAGALFFLIVSFSSGKKITFIFPVLLFLIALLSLTSQFGLTPFLERLSAAQNILLSGHGRIAMWKSTLEMITNHPVFGSGIGTFQYIFPGYQNDMLSGAYISHAHNDYLELAAEMGIIGLLTGLTGILFFFITGIKKLGKHHGRTKRIGALSACFSILVHALTDFNFHIPSNVLLFTLCVFYSIHGNEKTENRQSPEGSRNQWKGRNGLAAFFMLSGILFSMTVVGMSCAGRYFSEKAENNIRLKDYVRAEADIHRAALYDPLNPYHFSLSGDIALLRSRARPKKEDFFIQHALISFRKALRLFPGNSYVHTRIAYCLKTMKKLEEAETHFRQAIVFNRSNPFVYYDMGFFYLSTNRFAKASEYFGRMLLLDDHFLTPLLDTLSQFNDRYAFLRKMLPENPGIRKKFSSYLMRRNHVAEAVRELDFVFFLEPTLENAISHINGILKGQDCDISFERIDNYYFLFGKQLPLVKIVARLYENRGYSEKAVAMYQEIMKNDPGDSSSVYSLYRLYRKLKKPAAALGVLREGLSRHPSDDRLYYYLYLYYRDMREPEAALPSLKKAVEFAPKQVGYRLELGKYYARLELYEEAVTQWKKCLAIDPGNSPCRKAIDNVFEKLGLKKKK